LPIIHKIKDLYKDIYQLGKIIPKRDKFGVYLKIESLCIDCLKLAISAALAPSHNKAPILHDLRVSIEMLKQIIRTMNELKIINNNKYFSLESSLIEISKMAAGWHNYVNKKKPK